MVKQANYPISKILAEEIKDSRGNPTIKVTVWARDNSGSFSVPSGASTGIHEAHELRDPEPEQARYGAGKHGKGVKMAIDKVNNVIAPVLVGKNILNQKEIDRIMIELDSSRNKDNLGANSMVGVSIACAKAAAKITNQETYQYLQTLAEIKPSRQVPYLFMNLIEGGKHTSNMLAFQEYHVVPDTENAADALDMGIKIQNALKEIIEKDLGKKYVVLGDEGGFAPKINDIRKPLLYLSEAIKQNNFKNKVFLSLDVAASSFFKPARESIEWNGYYKIGEKDVSSAELMDIYDSLIFEFDLFSIEDPFNEEDFKNFKNLKEKNKNLIVVGDDLTVSNKFRLNEAIEKKSINAMIIKPNQIGTLSETLETMKLARENDIKLIVSHRGEETEDDFIADLAYAFGCFGLKAGSSFRPERMVKYQRLIKISTGEVEKNNMDSKAQILATIGPATQNKEIIRKMVDQGMDAARLNSSWGTYEEHAGYIKNIKKVRTEADRNIPIILDLSGPRIQDINSHKFDNTALELITPKDLADLKFGIEQEVDYVAMSFVGEAKDILELRGKMQELGKVLPIIAKIERKIGVRNIDEIIKVSNAIMVARGDLGSEVPLEQIPFIQKDIIDKCKASDKPVIVATQMMDSMMRNPDPTRAEVTDIVYAVLGGADILMLSEETTVGKYPVESVTMMEKVIVEAEKHSGNIKINKL